MVIGYDPLGVAVIKPGAVTDETRQDLRRAVHKLLSECPTAILIDLSEVSHVPSLMQTTLLSLTVEASQEPATPLGFCTANAGLARELKQNGPAMQVFRDLDEARRALTNSAPGTPWIQRRLGSGSDAPRAAADHVTEACQTWKLSEIQAAAARETALQLVWMARGPYELHLTVSLRSRGQLLINVRNYSTAARSLADRSSNRIRLSPADEARILAAGAAGCGRLVTGAGVAWWAIINGRVG